MFEPEMSRSILNDEWLSEDTVPDPKPLPNIPGYKILIRPVPIRSKTKGGILLPDKAKDDMKYLTTVGRVLSVGDLAYADEQKFLKGPWCKPGDYVCYGKHTGDKFLYKGVRLIICYDDEITMVIKDPASLDPLFNLSN
jgi:co-chaperonin GroES (HSP10)